MADVFEVFGQIFLEVQVFGHDFVQSPVQAKLSEVP